MQTPEERRVRLEARRVARVASALRDRAHEAARRAAKAAEVDASFAEGARVAMRIGSAVDDATWRERRSFAGKARSWGRSMFNASLPQSRTKALRQLARREVRYSAAGPVKRAYLDRLRIAARRHYEYLLRTTGVRLKTDERSTSAPISEPADS